MIEIRCRITIERDWFTLTFGRGTTKSGQQA